MTQVNLVVEEEELLGNARGNIGLDTSHIVCYVAFEFFVRWSIFSLGGPADVEKSIVLIAANIRLYLGIIHFITLYFRSIVFGNEIVDVVHLIFDIAAWSCDVMENSRPVI